MGSRLRCRCLSLGQLIHLQAPRIFSDVGSQLLGPRVGPYSLFLGFRFPYKVLETKKGTLFITKLLLGLDYMFERASGVELRT